MKFFFKSGLDIQQIFSYFSEKQLDDYNLQKVSANFVFENDPIIKIEKKKDTSIITVKGEDFNKWFDGDLYYDQEDMVFRASKSGFLYRNSDLIKIFDPFFVTKDNMEAYLIFPDIKDEIKSKIQDKTFKYFFKERYVETKTVFLDLEQSFKNSKYDEVYNNQKEQDIQKKDDFEINENLEIKFNNFIKTQYELIKQKNFYNFKDVFFKNIINDKSYFNKYKPGFYLIAIGKLPKNGRCEKIIPLIEDKVIPGKLDSKNRINFFERDFLKSVRKGDALAKILPEIKSEDGYDVYGNIIPASYDNKPFFLPGDNVERNNNLLISKIDGVISFKKNTINVFDLYKIDGDVSVYTGNIHCNSSLIVTGSVLENITLEVNGDLIVYGNISHPNSLIVKGNLICKGGIIGDRNKKYIVESSLYANFVENAYIEVKGNICIDKEIVRSRLFAGKNIIATFSNGVVIGSELHFGGHFLLKFAGTSHGAGNNSFLGHSFLAERNLKFLESEYEKYTYLEKNYSKLKESKLTNNIKNIKKDYNKKNLNLVNGGINIDNIKDNINFDNLTFENIKLKRKILYKLLKRSKDKLYNIFSKIVVMNMAYAGNKIIGKRGKEIIENSISNPIIFYNEDYKIVFSKISSKNIINLKNELERFYKLKNFENNIDQKKVEIKDAKKSASKNDKNITFKDKWGSFR